MRGVRSALRYTENIIHDGHYCISAGFSEGCAGMAFQPDQLTSDLQNLL